MTSKEALNHIVNGDYNEMICTYPSILAYNGMTQKDMMKLIEKDLEVLEQHKKIEEELGIDLTTLLKALKRGFYAITDKEHNTIGFIKGGELYSRLCFDTKKIYTIGSNENYYFKNYGKTWALTKEELENEKD